MKKEQLTQKAQLVMAVSGYENAERRRWGEGIDYLASQPKSGAKMLLRIVTEPRSKSGVTGLDVVKQMSEVMKRDGIDKGVLISESFTEAAAQGMRRDRIEMVSDKLPARFDARRLYLAMRRYAGNLCQTKYGYVSKKQPDCPGKCAEDCHSCDVRVISDNASFHFERGWVELVRGDFEALIGLDNSIRPP